MLADERLASQAGSALPAVRNGSHDHVITCAELCDTRSHCLDDPCPLMPEDRGQGNREETMHHTHIRVTHPGRNHLDKYLAKLGFADLDVADGEWRVLRYVFAWWFLLDG